jgi:sulfatase modifying factor 1
MRSVALLVALLGGCELAVNTDGLDGGCPKLPGAPLVKVTTPGGTFCIDSTEVTNAQYARFATATTSSAAPPQACAQSTGKTPTTNWPPPPGYDDIPVVDVTWCQAYAFCAWEGKRLCGQIGGGSLAELDATSPSFSQWLYACTDGGSRAYPYGNTYSGRACGGQAVASNIAPVGSRAGCVGGFAGIDDMSGNVWEWTDTCQSNAPGAFCHALGGAFDSMPDEMACLGERNWTRTASAGNIGIRCCLDL